MTDKIVYLFTTAGCARCQSFLPTFESWSGKYGDRADFVIVHLDNAPAEAVERLRVTAVPTVVVVREEREIARFVGVPKEEDIAAVLEGTKGVPQGTPRTSSGEEGE